MSRRGNRNSRAVVEQRRIEVADRLKKGERRGALAKELGVSRMTLHRDIAALTARFQAGSTGAFAEYREAHLKVLQQMAQAVLEEKVSTDVAAQFRLYQQDIAKLLGLNAESRSVVAHVSAEVDPSKLIGYRKFCYETRFLSNAQLERVFEFIRGLKPEPRAITAEMLPPAEEEDDFS